MTTIERKVYRSTIKIIKRMLILLILAILSMSLFYTNFLNSVKGEKIQELEQKNKYLESTVEGYEEDLIESKNSLTEQAEIAKQANLKMKDMYDKYNYEIIQNNMIVEFIAKNYKGMTVDSAYKISNSIVKECAKYDIDTWLVVGVIARESKFNPKAVGGVGEIGLMQILPNTGKRISEHIGMKYDKQKLFEIEVNIKYGVWYLNYLINKMESLGYNNNKKISLALLCYNRGEGNVMEDLRRKRNPSNGYEKAVMSFIS